MLRREPTPVDSSGPRTDPKLPSLLRPRSSDRLCRTGYDERLRDHSAFSPARALDSLPVGTERHLAVITVDHHSITDWLLEDDLGLQFDTHVFNLACRNQPARCDTDLCC